MDVLQFKDGELAALEGLSTRLIDSPWRWEILLTQAERPSGSEHYGMVLKAIRDCVAIEDPNADRDIWSGVRKLEESQNATDREAARMIANAAKAERPGVEVNK